MNNPTNDQEIIQKSEWPSDYNIFNIPINSVEEPAKEDIVDDDVLVLDQVEDSHEDQVEIKTELSSNDNLSEEKIIRKQQQVKIEKPLSKAVKNKNTETVSLPTDFNKEVYLKSDRLPDIEVASNEKTLDWVDVLKTGSELNTPEEAFVSSLEREGSDWTNSFEHNKVPMSGAYISYNSTKDNSINGEFAVIKLLTHLGIGRPFQAPQYHSGFWVSFKAPGDSAIIDFNRSIITDKISLGRYTYGLVFNNTTVYSVERCVNFAIDFMTDCTVSGINKENIKDHLLVQDIPSFLWGIVCAMYPRGFNYRRSCINDPTKCNYILEDTIDVSKMLFIDRGSLNVWQKTNMSSRTAKSKNLESLKTYSNENTRIGSRSFSVNEGLENEITFTIKSPTVNQFIEAGHKWVDDIVNLVEEAMKKGGDKEFKERLLLAYERSSKMMYYSHWVESIKFGDYLIDDKDTINNSLIGLSSDTTILPIFMEEVQKYINDSTISLVGIPKYECPQCGMDQDVKHSYEGLDSIIPLDVLQLFFALTGQRLVNILNR